MGFHVPRVTISIDFGKEASFGELSLISLGYGLHQAWIYGSMFDKGGIFGTAPLEVSPLNEELSLAYFMSILVYGTLLLIASALDTKLIRFFHATPTLVGAAALGTVGTLLLLLPASAGWNTEMTQIASGVLTGAGSSVLLIAWGIPSRGATRPLSSSTGRCPSPSASASTAWCCTSCPSPSAPLRAPSFPWPRWHCCSCCAPT